MYFCKRAMALAPLAFALFVSTTQAQNSHGSITGLLTDSSGGAIYGAQVTLQPLSLKAVTDRLGSYTFADLTPGAYTISVSFVGFAPLFGGTYDWNGRGINDVELSPTTTQLTICGPYYGTYSGEDLRDYAISGVQKRYGRL